MALSRRLYFYKEEPFSRYGPGFQRGNGTSDDYVIFFTDDAINFLRRNNFWCVDGTFTTIPTPFLQLYTISYMVHNNIFPAVYCFMKKKSEQTYKEMFNTLLNIVGELNPQYIKTDFEKVTINAMIEVFPSALISGCLFHFGQAIQRQLQSFGLIVRYRKSGG